MVRGAAILGACLAASPAAAGAGGDGVAKAASGSRPIAHAVSLFGGEVTNAPVAEPFALPFSDRFAA